MIGYAVAGLVLAYGMITFIGRMIVRMSTEFGVTDHRIIVKRGLISLHTIEMSVDKVESVDVDQTIIGRMLGYGAVTVHGVGARWDPLPGLADPIGFRNAITARTAPRLTERPSLELRSWPHRPKSPAARPTRPLTGPGPRRFPPRAWPRARSGFRSPAPRAAGCSGWRTVPTRAAGWW